MGFYSVDPIRFGSLSMVTSSLGPSDPKVGDRTWADGREYVFVYNDGGEDIGPGFGGVLQSGATGMSVTVSSVTSDDICVGVVRHATLTTGTYGWLVSRGITNVEMNATSGTVAAGGLIEIAANGDFSPVSNTTANLAPAVGKALEAIVSSASGSAYISCY
jgi:hypothetical protein